MAQAAEMAGAAKVQHALACLRKEMEYRKEDAKRHARNRRCRGDCAPARNCRDCHSRDAHAFMHALMGDTLAALQERSAV